jgi:glucose/arabinose dehydrogenase
MLASMHVSGSEVNGPADRRRLCAAAALAALMCLLATDDAGAVIIDSAFTETPFVSAPELGGATGLAWAPDGSSRLFVTRKDGLILIIKNGVLLPTPFATVTPLYQGSECGLLGIAFDPNFLVTRHLFVFATVSASEQQIIRYTVSGDTGTEKTTVVAGLPTNGANHDGGAIGFGPDGKLYWAIGDLGNGSGVGADLSSLAAKIGRANPDGTPVIDNPHHDGQGPNADHIWARGFRNPFTFEFQPATGLLWVQDVGSSYEQIFIVRRGDHAGWNSFENNQPEGFLPPIIKYGTNRLDTLAVASPVMMGATRRAGQVTISTTAPHGFRLGEKITVAGVADASFNGDYFVSAVPTPTSFRAPRAGGDAVSGGGSASSQNIGGCVTGGVFYDATGFPPAYRGNFFFGDYNSGRIERVVLDAATNTVTSVDHWVEGVAAAVDMALGPDGALYYVGVSSNAVFRASHNATTQALVVSPAHLWAAEGQPALFTVRLAVSPAADVTVTVARAEGDAEVAVQSGASLTFTGSNWNTPQPVTVAVGRDLDADVDLATIALRATGLDTQLVTVQARDDNDLQLRLSTATLTVDEGRTGSFTVMLTHKPSLDVTVRVRRLSGDDDLLVSGNPLTFTPSTWSTPQSITVGAASDSDAVDDTGTISVESPGLPSRALEITVRDDDAPPSSGDAGADGAAPGPPDGGAVSGGVDMPSMPTPLDAQPDVAPSDGPPGDARAEGRPVGAGGAGCGCRVGGDHTASAAGTTAGCLLLVALVCRARRRRRATRLTASGAER